MSSNPSPCIKLEHSHSAHSLDKDEVVHKQQFHDFQKLVERIVIQARAKKNVAEDPAELDFARSHDVITIHGQRGVGKTTFMLSAIKAVTMSPVDSLKQFSLCHLGVIDPTLMGGRENILLIILQKIKEAVERQQRSKGCTSAMKRSCAFADWRENLRSLGEGLQTVGAFIDGDNKSSRSGEVDSQLWLTDSMLKAKHGADLERDFHFVLNGALKLIEKDAFIIGVDDVDTRFEAGWPVLETIRKYLTSPQLIVVLSGDIELYSELVRQAQYKMFGFDLRKPPEANSREEQLIETLIEQYLMKILPPQNHLRLSLMSEYPSVEIEWRVKGEDGPTRRLLTELLDEIVRKEFRALNPTAVSLFTNALLSQPIRTLLRFLNMFTAFDDNLGVALSDNKEVLQSERNLSIKFGELYRAQLQRFGLNFNDYTQLCSFPGIACLVSCLHKTHMAQTKGLALQPRFSETWKNSIMFPLNARLLEGGKNGGMGVAYFIRGCLFSEALFKDVESANKKESSSMIGEFLHMDIEENLGVTGRRFTGVLDNYVIPFGSTISDFRKNGKFESTWSMLPAVRLVSTAEKVVKISILPLIGLVGDLLIKKDEWKKQRDPKNKDVLLELVENHLEPLQQLRNYPVLKNEIEVVEGNNAVAYDKAEESVQDESKKDVLSELITQWLFDDTFDSEEDYTVSPSVVAQGHIRFQNTMSRRSNLDCPSDDLQQTIVIFLYSLLLEEFLYENEPVRVVRSNPDKTARLLANLYNRVVADYPTQCRFSRKIITCPVWWLFLDKDQDNYLKKLILNGDSYKKEFAFEKKLNLKFRIRDFSLSNHEVVTSVFKYQSEEIEKLFKDWKEEENKTQFSDVLSDLVKIIDNCLEEESHGALLKKRNTTIFLKTVLPLLTTLDTSLTSDIEKYISDIAKAQKKGQTPPAPPVRPTSQTPPKRSTSRDGEE